MSVTKHAQLHLGDMFEVVKTIPDESIDFVFADPPYFLSSGGMSIQSGKQVSVNKGDWDTFTSAEDSASFHHAWISEVKRTMKPDATIVISGTYHSIFKCGEALDKLGFKLLNDIVWFKPNGAPNLSGRRLAASHELLLWASKSGQSKFVFNYEDLKFGEFEKDYIKKPGKQMRSVWWIASTPRSEKLLGSHPTQKPLALMERIVRAFTLPGSLILDPFMGSGSTGVSAIALDRRFVGIEQSRDFFELAKKRMGAAS